MNWYSEHLNWVGIGIAGLLSCLYVVVTRGTFQRGTGLYFLGLGLLLLVQLLPLHTGGFPAHMIGHVVLLLICAPLLVLGFPKAQYQSAARFIERLSRFLQLRPWVGWLAGLGVMWFWHLPVVFNATLSQPHEGQMLVPILNTVSLLGAGMAFSWPILGPLHQYRINPLVGVLYLFTACMGCSLLGLFITFAPPGLYTYFRVVEHAGIVETLCGNWGASQADGQQLAGLIMWVPCCFIYLTGAMYLLRTWLLTNEDGLVAG